MVQYRNTHHTVDDTNYWKLVRVRDEEAEQLWHRRQHYPQATRAARDTTRLAARNQRGLMNYYDCHPDELVRFCKARGLHPEMGRKMKMKKLVKTLEQADEVLTFKRFLSLPPEIRLYVYEWYQAWLLETLKREFNCPPPIASVSKLVRQECLSVFFRERMFFARHLGCRTPLLSQTYQFFAKSSFLRYVKRLTILSPIAIRIRGADDGDIGYAVSDGYAEWYVNLSASGRDATASFATLGTAIMPDYGSGELVEKAKTVEKRLRAIVDAVIVRKRAAFMAEDAVTIVQALFKGSQSGMIMA